MLPCIIYDVFVGILSNGNIGIDFIIGLLDMVLQILVRVNKNWCYIVTEWYS